MIFSLEKTLEGYQQLITKYKQDLTNENSKFLKCSLLLHSAILESNDTRLEDEFLFKQSWDVLENNALTCFHWRQNLY